MSSTIPAAGGSASTNSNSAQDSARYEYRKLDPNSDEIRLFRLRGSSFAAIRGSIEIFRLSECPPFSALSYEWGTHSSPATITIKEKHLRVGRNLKDFLDALATGQHAQRMNYLWIDQVCIDQTSCLEKNHQVSMMRRIYASAQQVIAWLGTGMESCLSDLHEHRHALSAMFKPEHDADPATQVCQLMDSTYFSRLWVQQELVLAQKVTLAAGNFWCPGEDLVMFKDWLVTWQPALWHVVYGWKIYDGSSVVYELYDAVTNYCHKLCEEPRDKVYALLGLLHQNDRELIRVDYDMSVEEVFEMAAEIIVVPSRIGRICERELKNRQACRQLGEEMGLKASDIDRILNPSNGPSSSALQVDKLTKPDAVLEPEPRSERKGISLKTPNIKRVLTRLHNLLPL